MRRLRKPGGQLHALLALLFILSSFVSPAALAAIDDAPASVDLRVTSFTCLGDPGNVSLTAGTIPDDCTPAAGVVMTVQSDVEGDATTCTTLADGSCAVTVTAGATITVWQDTTLLSGTTPRMNPITTPVVDFTEITFINLPVAAPEKELPAAPEGLEAPQDAPETTSRLPESSLNTTSNTDNTGDETAGETGDTGETTEGTEGAKDESTGDSKDETTGEIDSTSDTKDETTGDEDTTPESTATVTPPATVTVTPSATVSPEATVTPSPTATPVTKTYATVAYTGGAGLRCRADASTSSTTITVLAEGTKVETRGAAVNGWIPVTCAGQSGWIYAGYATTATETTTPDPTTTPAPGGTVGTATVVGTGGAGLRCRADASTAAAIITVLAEGTKVETRGAAVNGWLPVKCAGVDGWLYTTYTRVDTTAGPTPSPTPTTPPVSGDAGWGTVRNTGGGGLNCRTSASLSGTVITILSEGASVETRGETVNGWVPVKCGGQNGWVSSSYFVRSTSGTAPTPTPTPTQTPSAGTGTYAMVSGTGYGGLNCRTSATTSSSVITILPEGTRVETRGSTVNGWVPVKCGGQNGWVSASYVLIGAGTGTGTGAVWMDINLSTQYMVVYRGSTVIGQTYVSTGRYGFDTPPGTFYTNWKLTSQTMTGVLGGEYYYVEDVPWVMYFTNRGHAIHGAYWHNNFGYRMSHGCVNLPVPFAKWLYEISPIGTRIYIHF